MSHWAWSRDNPHEGVAVVRNYYLLAVKGFSRLRPHDGMAHTGLDIRPQSRHNWTEIQ
jgi:hypothetical protein